MSSGQIVFVFRTFLFIIFFLSTIPIHARQNNSAFRIVRQGENYFLHIADTLLGRDILVVSRLSGSAAGVKRSGPLGYGGYAGDKTNENLVRFEKGPGNNLLLKKVLFTSLASDSSRHGMYHAVMNSNGASTAASFPIQSMSAKGANWIIDITGYLLGDNDVLFFDQTARSALQLNAFQADRSYIRDVRAYSRAIVIQTVKTYSHGTNRAGSNTTTAGFATFELYTTLLLLPEKPMRPRYADRRIGYFTKEISDYDLDPQGVKKSHIIKRWRLEPQPGEMEKYINGELVEPAKPIVFYIDPATPQKWVPYLIQGVNDWQAAFELAGFKNAIVGLPAPSKNEDSTWSPADARHSVIVYQASDTKDASYSTVTDPRSGEIIECHIKWYHNVMKLLRNWYFIQASPSDPRARKTVFADSLMGRLIRYICSHEIGHALGLSHNFGASATYPVEKLRRKQWVQKNGFCPSIMDYARFNYVARPGDGISGDALFPRVNYYDKWAIAWGYRLIPGAGSAREEKDSLRKWVSERSDRSKYRFGNGDKYPINDPRTQSEDLGDDAMKAGDYGIKNLQYVLVHLIKWTRTAGDFTDLKELYHELTDQFTQYMKHVAANIGGIYETPTADGITYAFTPESIQRKALAFLHRHLFKTPAWLLNKDILARTGDEGIQVMDNVHSIIINRLLDSRTISKLITAEAQEGAKIYTVRNLLQDLRNSIWTELYSHRPIDIYRRNLQNRYVNAMQRLVNTQRLDAAQLTIPGIARADLAKLAEEIHASIPRQKHAQTLHHLKDLLSRIENVPQKKLMPGQEQVIKK